MQQPVFITSFLFKRFLNVKLLILQMLTPEMLEKNIKSTYL